MTQTLLQLALALLIAAQGPNVTPALRAEAISVATEAINYATITPMPEQAAPQVTEIAEAPYDGQSTPVVAIGAAIPHSVGLIPPQSE